jgi:hypothetical protein
MQAGLKQQEWRNRSRFALCADRMVGCPHGHNESLVNVVTQ